MTFLSSSEYRRFFVLGFAAGIAACNQVDTSRNFELGVADAASDAGADAASDAAADADGEPDVQPDAEPDAGEDASPEDVADPGLRPAPEIPGPERSAALDNIYCGLDNGQLVQASLRAAECLDFSVIGFLEDASRGLIHGPMLESGYFRASGGDCEFIACLNNATTCDAALACDAARSFGACDDTPYVSRCDGNDLVRCNWDGERYQWQRMQACERLGGTCVSQCVGDNCFEEAWCDAGTVSAECGYYGACAGDVMVRCGQWNAATGETLAHEIPCGELVEGGTCREFSVGGEVPGPACVAAEPDCEPGFGQGFECLDETTMQTCVFGKLVPIDCRDFGYSRCGFRAEGEWGGPICQR